MPRPTYRFDTDGHTVVEDSAKKKERKTKTPRWLDEALNEGDGVYRP
jgi:hypothetical protein